MVKKGKYITVGIGSSKLKDPYDAAVAACKQALAEAGGKSTFAQVYTTSDVDPARILKGVNEIIGKQWVGVSADKLFDNVSGYDPNVKILVAIINSEYLHFSVSIADKYHKSPRKKAQEATRKAIEQMHGDKHVDAYVQFARVKNDNYGSIMKTPPYFLLTFLSGIKMTAAGTVPGEEGEFLSGVLDYTGPNIPVFGGSASSSLEGYLKNKADNFQFAGGKLYHDAAIVVFVVSNLQFSMLTKHGYDKSSDFAAVTKLDKTGFKILELNGKEPIAEYARILGVSASEFLKQPDEYSFTRPFGLLLEDGSTIIREGVPDDDGSSLRLNFKLNQNALLNVLTLDEKSTCTTPSQIVTTVMSTRKKKPALIFFCSCSGRRMLAKDIETRVSNDLSKRAKGIPYVGFYSFSEIGSTDTTYARVHSQTVTSLALFDSLLSDN